MFRHVQEVGLVISYCNDPAINMWIRVVFGTAFLPSEMVRIFLENHLAQWPQPQTPAINEALSLFAGYIKNQWIPRIDLWNHHENRGPRTTNHAEGYILIYFKPAGKIGALKNDHF